MNAFLKALVIVQVLVPTILHGAGPAFKPVIVANATNRFAVTGMVCNHCAQGIAYELRRAKGVAMAEVSFTNGVAVVAYDTNRVSVKKLVKVIQEAGYEARLIKN